MVAEKPHCARVVAAVIRRGDQLLICQRPTGKRYGLLWEFPGGKLRDGESPTDAAARELEEELALSVVSAGGLLFSHADPGSEYVIEFIEVEVEGTPGGHQDAPPSASEDSRPSASQ